MYGSDDPESVSLGRVCISTETLYFVLSFFYRHERIRLRNEKILVARTFSVVRTIVLANLLLCSCTRSTNRTTYVRDKSSDGGGNEGQRQTTKERCYVFCEPCSCCARHDVAVKSYFNHINSDVGHRIAPM